MKYNAYDYFRKCLMYLSDKMGANIQEKDISTYLKALSNCFLVEESIQNYSGGNEIYFDINIPNNNVYLRTYIDTVDNSLNCITDLHNAYYRIKLINDKLYYSIWFETYQNSDRKDLKGIYFYETDKIGDTTYKFYDGKVVETLSDIKYRNLDLILADDSMLQNHGFSPDYEEKHDYNGMLEFDAARAFNDLILTMNYEKAIEFMSSINKKTTYEYNLELVKRN